MFVKLLLNFSLLTILFINASIATSISKDLQIKKLERAIDVSTQLVKTTYKITYHNSGKTPQSKTIFTIPKYLKSHLSFISAEASDNVPIEIKETSAPDIKESHFYQVTLPKPLAPGATTSVIVHTVLTRYLRPYPSHITQSQRQLVVYEDSHYAEAPYPSEQQVTTITLPSSTVESYSRLKPSVHSESTITYGPYENVPAFAFDKMTVHFENNQPFLAVTNLDRSIEVSHWGVISIEERIDVRHIGAELQGSFSRHDYQQRGSGSGASVRSWRTVLPAAAADVYYRDDIGNISTSHLRVRDDAVEVELRPRFPLFGGWKTFYILGYTVPTYEYLFTSGSKYLLKIRFVDHVFDDSVIDSANVRIVLPEGSRNIELKLPYPITRLPDETHSTYLDTVGRPVVVLHKSNLVENHIADIEVHYTFDKILMLQEPLLVVGALYLLFLAVIAYVRLDFSIESDPAKEGRLRVAGLASQIRAQQDRRAEVYARYDTAMQRLKTSRELSAFQATARNLNTEHRNLTQAITDLSAKLKTEGASVDVLDKVTEIQKLDKQLKEQLQQQATNLEKLVASKLSKQQYIELEAAASKRKEELASRLQLLTSQL